MVHSKLRKLIISFIIIIIACIITISALFTHRMNNQIKLTDVSEVRYYTSSVLNDISEDFPLIEETTLSETLEDLGIKALIVDTSNNVLFNNSSIPETDITHNLYFEGVTTPGSDDNLLKISFPVKQGNTIVGFALFEIPGNTLYNFNYSIYYILLVIEAILFILTGILIFKEYKKKVYTPTEKLEKAMMDVSHGVYNKLEEPSKLFTSYNIMLDEIERLILNQATYAKTRKHMIANISHEIRTPLSYVKMSAEILSNDPTIQGKSRKYIDTILKKVNTIDTIIEDLFRYSIQDLDQLLVEPREVYAKQTFDEILSNIKLKDVTKTITLQTSNLLPNMLVRLDQSRIEQVVTNLVDNSEKHIVQKGKIDVSAELFENHVIVIVEDDGTGIKPKDLPYIFEPFYQGEQPENTKKKGAGLGLAISDYLVKKHGGEIFVYSDEQKGTKFVVKLVGVEK